MKPRASLQHDNRAPTSTLGMSLPWPLPYTAAEAVPWDQDSAADDSKESAAAVVALTKALRGCVQSKYTGSSELLFTGRRPQDDLNRGKRTVVWVP